VLNNYSQAELFRVQKQPDCKKTTFISLTVHSTNITVGRSMATDKSENNRYFKWQKSLKDRRAMYTSRDNFKRECHKAAACRSF
jgi:hypothetical protein